jgi:hypothetical protein
MTQSLLVLLGNVHQFVPNGLKAFISACALNFQAELGVPDVTAQSFGRFSAVAAQQHPFLSPS